MLNAHIRSVNSILKFNPGSLPFYDTIISHLTPRPCLWGPLNFPLNARTPPPPPNLLSLSCPNCVPQPRGGKDRALSMLCFRESWLVHVHRSRSGFQRELTFFSCGFLPNKYCKVYKESTRFKYCYLNLLLLYLYVSPTKSIKCTAKTLTREGLINKIARITFL